MKKSAKKSMTAIITLAATIYRSIIYLLNNVVSFSAYPIFHPVSAIGCISSSSCFVSQICSPTPFTIISCESRRYTPEIMSVSRSVRISLIKTSSKKIKRQPICSFQRVVALLRNLTGCTYTIYDIVFSSLYITRKDGTCSSPSK